ncbi:hypothetical protein OGAPHI_005223 [Ogataea philodendri]|uniref:Uncharacterized protein n=1 Tax=Ogataea philodendri TaxID=1378263 RepID=A0A9P8P2A0_9ASCO|nr:uncharacterized protein OGAPHI_005223 [Ogataea philodendri]KAH3663820.1 hypothetical protein OGAPHI_005223 [Ogataea philodendri]
MWRKVQAGGWLVSDNFHVVVPTQSGHPNFAVNKELWVLEIGHLFEEASRIVFANKLRNRSNIDQSEIQREEIAQVIRNHRFGSRSIKNRRKPHDTLLRNLGMDTIDRVSHIIDRLWSFANFKDLTCSSRYRPGGLMVSTNLFSIIQTALGTLIWFLMDEYNFIARALTSDSFTSIERASSSSNATSHSLKIPYTRFVQLSIFLNADPRTIVEVWAVSLYLLAAKVTRSLINNLSVSPGSLDDRETESLLQW